MSFRSMFVLAVAVATGMVQVEVPGQNLVLSAGSQKVFGAEPQKQKDPGNWHPSGDVLGFTGKGGEPFALENGGKRRSAECQRQPRRVGLNALRWDLALVARTGRGADPLPRSDWD